MKNSSDTVGNRTCDLPICSTVPQPTAPPRAPFVCMEVTQTEPEFKTELSIVEVCATTAMRGRVSLHSSPLHLIPLNACRFSTN
jgi:hypothetical protein